jgi:hypothetical protein
MFSGLETIFTILIGRSLFSNFKCRTLHWGTAMAATMATYTCTCELCGSALYTHYIPLYTIVTIIFHHYISLHITVTILFHHNSITIYHKCYQYTCQYTYSISYTPIYRLRALCFALTHIYIHIDPYIHSYIIYIMLDQHATRKK